MDGEDAEEYFGHFKVAKVVEGGKRLKPYYFQPRKKNVDVRRPADPDSGTAEAVTAASTASQPEVAAVDHSDEVDPDELERRLASLSWCDCGRCSRMTRAVDCFCCRESAQARAMLPDGVQCITQHPEFADVCLKRHILVLFLRGYREFRGGKTDEHWNR